VKSFGLDTICELTDRVYTLIHTLYYNILLIVKDRRLLMRRTLTVFIKRWIDYNNRCLLRRTSTTGYLSLTQLSEISCWLNKRKPLKWRSHWR